MRINVTVLARGRPTAGGRLWPIPFPMSLIRCVCNRYHAVFLPTSTFTSMSFSWGKLSLDHRLAN